MSMRTRPSRPFGSSFTSLPRAALCAMALASGLAHAGDAGGAVDARQVLLVEVFANSAMHITPEPGAARPWKMQLYRLDALQRIEQQLSRALPQGEAEASAWLQANEARIRQQVTPQVVEAANGVALAHHYRINRLPAIVIDRKAVVYGITSVDAAIERYLQTRQAQEGRP
ncbi:TIGR03757 family integrating conjugative element protein [Comamonadaceae bacterium OH2545_COT-014]|nr:TIGR03757 family integrating conjugative element protein [Comamonadaceae bacterium OH2545_COT-014]